MFKNNKVICFILARGGSKGVKRKNAKLIAGKPLVAHTINVAKDVSYIDAVYVSTEDPEIKEISSKFGAYVIDRPHELATDTASYLKTVKHMIESIDDTKNNPYVVLLESTFPIRSHLDIRKCIELIDNETDCVASISKVKTHPAYLYKEKNGFLEPYASNLVATNRQQMEKLYAYNGSILVTTVNFLKNQKDVVFGGRMKGYLLDEKYSFDIDTQLDFDICDYLLKK